MKKKFCFACFSLLAIFIISCDKEDTTGKWKDNIKLSSKSAQFSSDTDSVTFTTQGSWWWVTEITINDSSYYDFQDTDMESSYNYSILRKDILVERRNETTLFIKADANLTGAIRNIIIGLEAGDYFDSVKITQAAE